MVFRWLCHGATFHDEQRPHCLRSGFPRSLPHPDAGTITILS